MRKNHLDSPVPKDVTDNTGKTWLSGYDDGDRLTGTTETINSTYGPFAISRLFDGVSNLTGIKAPTESKGTSDRVKTNPQVIS